MEGLAQFLKQRRCSAGILNEWRLDKNHHQGSAKISAYISRYREANNKNSLLSLDTHIGAGTVLGYIYYSVTPHNNFMM